MTLSTLSSLLTISWIDSNFLSGLSITSASASLHGDMDFYLRPYTINEIETLMAQG
jgi:hypothetical protein